MENNPSIKLLPNPFQNKIEPKNEPTTSISGASASHFIPGYRTKFSVNEQKALYEQRKRQQQQQKQQQHLQHHQQQPQQQQQQQQQQQKPQPKHQRPANNQRTHLPNENRSDVSPSEALGTKSNWCELCKCGFKQPYQLQKHINEHEKCWFDNCTFEGHSMLLKEHIEAEHDSGLFQRVAKVEADEDIEKWRAERRKRYPTRANVEARRLAQEERLKRGERLQEQNKRFGDAINRKRAQTCSLDRNDEPIKHNQSKNKKRNRRHQTKHVEKIAANTAATSTPPPPPPSSSSSLAVVNNEVAGNGRDGDEMRSMCTDSTVATSEKECDQAINVTQSKPNALLALMGVYGDSESENEDDNDNSAAASQHQNGGHATNVAEINCKRVNSESTESQPLFKQFKVDTDCGETETIQDDESDDNGVPDEQPIERRPDDFQPETKKPADGVQRVKSDKKAQQQVKALQRNMQERSMLNITRKLRKQNTLLEKLLEKDIRHERNVLLQCVRYVVENKFFGIGQSKSS